MFENILIKNKISVTIDIMSLNNKRKKENYFCSLDVNAFNVPNSNQIIIPAGILFKPFYDVNRKDSINYGAIGMVIGHEMIHSFDDLGRLYDHKGNMKNWWTKKDNEKFVKEMKKLIK